jgi:hypothetical protein
VTLQYEWPAGGGESFSIAGDDDFRRADEVPIPHPTLTPHPHLTPTLTTVY